MKIRLSDNFITSLWEDNDGHLWIGTYNGGLNIIDPKNYGKPGSVIKYRHDPNKITSDFRYGATSFLLEENGSLLITTFRGIDRINTIEFGHEKFQFEHLLTNIYCKKNSQDSRWHVVCND